MRLRGPAPRRRGRTPARERPAATPRGTGRAPQPGSRRPGGAALPSAFQTGDGGRSICRRKEWLILVSFAFFWICAESGRVFLARPAFFTQSSRAHHAARISMLVLWQGWKPLSHSIHAGSDGPAGDKGDQQSRTDVVNHSARCGPFFPGTIVPPPHALPLAVAGSAPAPEPNDAPPSIPTGSAGRETRRHHPIRDRPDLATIGSLHPDATARLPRRPLRVPAHCSTCGGLRGD